MVERNFANPTSDSLDRGLSSMDVRILRISDGKIGKAHVSKGMINTCGSLIKTDPPLTYQDRQDLEYACHDWERSAAIPP
ncbi:hypothetical protein F443_01192 [Phytophthora nicotianae P1569]|uniref:Uncharacterized protein n=1 Tax=Phytophthora nicotianae P1569 TaxID=1317065 RepID=V9FZJ4_PHYNI|nr:hypothetical protein F443_01192 [Phytophthora nicotianae P1569]